MRTEAPPADPEKASATADYDAARAAFLALVDVIVDGPALDAGLPRAPDELPADRQPQ